MNAQVLPFPSTRSSPDVVSPLAHFVRIGEAHRKLYDLHATSRLPVTRVVVDASRFRYQKEFIKTLRDEGAEIVLDTEAAELAAPAKFHGHVRNAPWAVDGASAPLGPNFFLKNAKVDILAQIAQFAVIHGVNVVLAPAHYLGDKNFSHWFEIDRNACIRLRKALDDAGGKHIAIDYPLITPHVWLNDHQTRGALVQGLADLPVDSVWIRASGFSSDVGPATLKRYIASVGAMHNLGKPIIADHVGGLVGLSVMASGVSSGTAHGIGERERFDASAWHKAPPERAEGDEFGRAVRVSLVALNKSLTVAELDLLSKAKGGRRLVSCGDSKCCAHGYDDMIADPRSHAAHQSFARHEALQSVPDLRRLDYLLSGPIAEAVRQAKQIASLKPSKAEAIRLNIDCDSLMDRLREQRKRLEKSKSALEVIRDSAGGTVRSRPLRHRGNVIAGSREQKQ
jgi:hypothetical protein